MLVTYAVRVASASRASFSAPWILGVWASGAAQAAQFVRIILRWRGVCRAFASRGVVS